MIHELKTAPVYFNRSWSGEKLFEVRKNDRHFQKGDSIMLMEWDGEKYTGHQIFGVITYVLSGFNATGLSSTTSPGLSTALSRFTTIKWPSILYR